MSFSIEMTQEEKNFGNWLAGFVDGEGCFCIRIQKRKEGDWRKEIFGANFQIALRADDLPILKQIKKFLKCGYISTSVRVIKGKPITVGHLMVSHREDLLKRIIPIFEQCPLRAKKARDFTIWKEAVKIIDRIKNRPVRAGRIYLQRRTPEDVAEFTALYQELRRIREYADIPEIVNLPKKRKKKTRATFDFGILKKDVLFS